MAASPSSEQPRHVRRGPFFHLGEIAVEAVRLNAQRLTRLADEAGDGPEAEDLRRQADEGWAEVRRGEGSVDALHERLLDKSEAKARDNPDLSAEELEKQLARIESQRLRNQPTDEWVRVDQEW